jgi:hypothetical protein
MSIDVGGTTGYGVASIYHADKYMNGSCRIASRKTIGRESGVQDTAKQWPVRDEVFTVPLGEAKKRPRDRESAQKIFLLARGKWTFTNLMRSSIVMLLRQLDIVISHATSLCRKPQGAATPRRI